MNQTQQPSRFKTGDLIRGRYRIQTFIGEGTMARVYYAFDTLLPTGAGSRDRALKILDPQETAVRHSMPAQEAIDAFKREANILLRITHPNIVRAYDYFEDNGLHILVLEYVSGTSLEAQRRQKKFTEPEVIDIADQILAALQYLHAEKIANRDLKPANIMMNTQNILKLIDFGTAREIGNTVSQGTSVIKGTAIGTPGYAAPEQWNGVVDKRSDIYAWGVIVRELLTGNDPQMFDTTPLTGFNPVLCQMVMGATKLDPNERYQSTEEMINELEMLDGKTITPLPPMTPLTNPHRITVQEAWNIACSATKKDRTTWTKEYENVWIGAIELEKRGLHTQAMASLKTSIARFKKGTNASTIFVIGITHELLGNTQEALQLYNEAATIDPKVTESFDGIARLDPQLQAQRQQILQQQTQVQAQKTAKRQKVINFFTAPIRWVKAIPNLLTIFFQIHPRHALNLLTPQKIWLLHMAAILGISIGIYQSIHVARFDIVSLVALAIGSFLLWCGILSIGHNFNATPRMKFSYTIFSLVVGSILIIINGPLAPYPGPPWGPRMQVILEAKNEPINLGDNWGKRANELDPGYNIRIFNSKGGKEPAEVQQLIVEERTGKDVKEIHMGRDMKDFYDLNNAQRKETIKTLNDSLNQGEKL